MTTVFRVRARLARARMTADGPSDVVVCMATYGPRLRTVGVVLESIARGTVRPGRLILVTDPGDRLPPVVRRMARRGLEVWEAPGRLGPHKKYYPFARSAPRFQGVLVTADDDVVHPRDWLAGLLAHTGPERVAAYRAHAVKVVDGVPAPYAEWLGHQAPGAVPCFVTGASGVAYPARLVRELGALGEQFLEQCPRADDVWINRQILRGGYHVELVRERSVHFTPVHGSWRSLSPPTTFAASRVTRQLGATFDDQDRRLLVEAATRTTTGPRP